MIPFDRIVVWGIGFVVIILMLFVLFYAATQHFKLFPEQGITACLIFIIPAIFLFFLISCGILYDIAFYSTFYKHCVIWQK